MTSQAPDPAPGINTGRAHPARIYDFMLGGKDHYLVDEQVALRMPPEAKDAALVNRAFMRRAIGWVAGTGVDQYLDIGTGIPTEPNLHQVAQKVNPASRVVYTDNDPIVLRHAEALLVSTPEGATGYVEADVRRPETIVEHARRFLDFSRPVCLSMIALLHYVTEEYDAHGIVRTLVGTLAPGSYLVMSHSTVDGDPTDDPVREARLKRQMESFTAHITLNRRTRADVLRFFDGLELVPPGLVTAAQWRPAPTRHRRGRPACARWWAGSPSPPTATAGGKPPGPVPCATFQRCAL